MSLSRITNQVSQTFFCKYLFKFLNGWAYPFIYALFVLVSSLLGLEIIVYFVTVLIVVLVCFFLQDSRPIIPPAVLIIYSTSWKHTPQPPVNSDFYFSGPVLILIGILSFITLSAFIYRMCAAKPEKNFFKTPTRLKSGLLMLAAAFLFNGVFSSTYDILDLSFGALIAASFLALFVFFYNTTNWDKKTGMYFAVSVALAAMIICIQILYALLFRDVWNSDGSINKDWMIAGWGMSNNFGGMLAMFLPVFFYLAYKWKHGWFFYLLSFFAAGCIAFTLSRTSLLTAAVIILVGAVSLSVIKNPQRKIIRMINFLIVGGMVVFSFVFREKIFSVFSTIFERGFDDSNRFAIWAYGIEEFIKAPFFGAGFYIKFYEDFGFDIANWFFPDMYHNILVQILASCGIIGMLAYLFHLAQVLNLFLAKPTAERVLYFAIILSISGASLLDNHIFHVFPALIYSISLVLWEKDVDAAHPLPKCRLLGRRIMTEKETKYQR